MSYRVGPVAIAVLVATLAACTTIRSGEAASGWPRDMDRAQLARCMTAQARAPRTAETVLALEGAYRLHLFAESPARAVSGTLELWPLHEGSQDPATPLLIGAAEIELGEVDATPGGDPSSRRADDPGVGVYSASGEIWVRLGSESNRRDRQRFDGAHSTLAIASIEADRFGGTWRSDIGAASSEGSFCAVRITG